MLPYLKPSPKFTGRKSIGVPI